MALTLTGRENKVPDVYLWAAGLAVAAVAVLLVRAFIRLKNEKLSLSRSEYWTVIGTALIGIALMVLYAIND